MISSPQSADLTQRIGIKNRCDGIYDDEVHRAAPARETASPGIYN